MQTISHAGISHQWWHSEPNEKEKKVSVFYNSEKWNAQGHSKLGNGGNLEILFTSPLRQQKSKATKHLGKQESGRAKHARNQ